MSAPIAVLGAGNGAHAFAGDLALRGHRVRLYNKFAEEIAALQAQGGVTLEGALAGFGALESSPPTSGRSSLGPTSSSSSCRPSPTPSWRRPARPTCATGN